ncbi:hypothetical protein CTheo_8614 [Ceratobasidium theobromae]|uniref:Uncharacterized protein n=1 Tax=Ceratobasidium theobromae TaxID=1582974 RepID=A0A5N5Q8E4_9AGAM|nr:hypothetical protein CTheo_8614 [Ceratobasidium theobromae]
MEKPGYKGHSEEKMSKEPSERVTYLCQKRDNSTKREDDIRRMMAFRESGISRVYCHRTGKHTHTSRIHRIAKRVIIKHTLLDAHEHVVTGCTVVKRTVTKCTITKCTVAEHTVAEHTIVEHTVVEHTVVEHTISKHTIAEHTVAEHAIAKHNIAKCMAPFSASARPRHEALRLMATLLPSSSFNSSSLAHIFTHRARCFYCPKELPNDSARRLHIEATLECQEAQRTQLQAVITKKREAEHRLGSLTASQAAQTSASEVPSPLLNTRKRKVTVETIPDEDDPLQRSPPPPVLSVRPSSQMDSSPLPTESQQSHSQGQARQVRGYGGLFVEEYPDPLAGSPVSEDRLPSPDLHAHMRSCGNLGDPENFETAELLMTSGLTDAAKDRHLKSSKYAGKTPWPSCDAMLKDVDKLLHGPEFTLSEIDIFDGRRPRTQYMVCRSIIDLLRDIFGNRKFKQHFRYRPMRLWKTAAKLVQVYGDAPRKRNVTIAALIVATDQTCLSIMCGGQKAYLVYVSLANIDKHWRRKSSKRAWVLLRLKAELVHQAMEKMFEPLRKASEEGVEIIHSRLAQTESPCVLDNPAELHEREETLSVLHLYFKHRDVGELQPLHLKPVWPWWGDIPEVNLSHCLPPDELHQLHQGIFKTHILQWLRTLVSKKTIDNCFATMTPAPGLWNFTKGVSGVSQWTRHESKLMAAQLLPIVAKELTPELAMMIRSLIDFIYRAHASTISETDLQAMETDLESFHDLKDLLVVRGVYKMDTWFNKIVKLHMLTHYVHMIHELGPPDGYNTEVPEHLHIEYTKVPWRASNKVRPLPQMITYIQRQEAIRIHRSYLDEFLGININIADELDLDYEAGDFDAEATEVVGMRDGDDFEDMGRDGESELDMYQEKTTYPNPRQHMLKNPTRKDMALHEVMNEYGTADIMGGITNFLVDRLGIKAYDAPMSRHNHVNIWHQLYLYHRPLDFAPFKPLRHEIIRARLPQQQVNDRPCQPGIWDVALYLEKPSLGSNSGPENDEKRGILRYRAGCVHTFFTLPRHLINFFPGQLTFLELFTPFDASVSPFTRMHATKHAINSHGQWRIVVVPVTDIVLACHLAPKLGNPDSRPAITPQTDLYTISKTFWLNHYYNHHFFQLVQHWRQKRLKPGLRHQLMYHAKRSQVIPGSSKLGAH